MIQPLNLSVAEFERADVPDESPMHRQNAEDWKSLTDDRPTIETGRKENWICHIGIPKDNPFDPPQYPGWHWRPVWGLRDSVMAARNGKAQNVNEYRPVFQKTELGYNIGGYDYPIREGFRQLQMLAFNKPLPISPIVLCDGIETLNDSVMDGDYHQAIRNRIRELDETADCVEDVDELVELKKFLNKNTFRSKVSLTHDGHKRCYDRVRKNIPAVIDLICKQDPELGGHFRQHIHIGSKCYYDGDVSFTFPPDP